MGNAARHLQLVPTSTDVMERRVADTDDGYTRIANELLEAVVSNDLTARQIKVVLAVIRKTYGFGKKTDWISGEQLSNLTGLSRPRCSTTKNELINMRVLITDGRKFGVNKVISEWEIGKPARRREYGATKHKAGHLYVFAVSANGPVKIGFTTRDAEERLREVNSNHYFGNQTASCFYVTPFNLNAGAIEPLIHQALSNKIIKGELFNISADEAIREISHACKTFLPSVTLSVTPSVTGDFTHVEHTKETIQKKKETTPKSPEGSLVEQEETKPKKQAASKFTFDRERFQDTWNCKAHKHGLPRIISISVSTEKGVKRLYSSHLKHCKDTKRTPVDIDTFINGYIEFGYTPSPYAMGDNPEGKKYGIDTALTQRIIDKIISQEV